MVDSAGNRDFDIRDIHAPERAEDVLRTAIGLVQERLPHGWTVDVEIAPKSAADAGSDATLRLRAPGGEEAILLVAAKRLLNTRDVPMALEMLESAASRWGANQEILRVLVARYIAPTTRDRIAKGGAGFVDATGNMLITAARPAIFLADHGADRDPWRGPGRPRGTLTGPPAARVVRGLVDFAPPYTAPELAERAGASTGATYRVLEFLEGEGLVDRQRYGQISDVRWRELLVRWSRDYGFAQSNTVATFLEPRGIGALTSRLSTTVDVDYVVTGSLAAERVAAYAPTRLATIYVRDLRAAAAALDLRRTETGANVALAAGRYDTVFQRTEVVDGLRIAALSQVAVDLLTGPGRNPSEATALLDWMGSHESQWRR